MILSYLKPTYLLFKTGYKVNGLCWQCGKGSGQMPSGYGCRRKRKCVLRGIYGQMEIYVN